MTIRLRCVVLSLLCLMTFATSAAADCAWVLWEQVVEKSNDKSSPEQATLNWHVHSAYDKLGPCVKEAENIANKTRAALKTLGGDGFNQPHGNGWDFWVVKVPSGKSVSDLWPILRRAQCLPDTIDPHEPKGK